MRWALVLAGALCLGTTATAAAPPARRVGTVDLTRCGPAYCGELRRPLDPAGLAGGELSIHFEFYPHRQAGRARGTLVATEGGPGYPATGSRSDYLALFRPLMTDRDVLLMDNRGTGRSGAVDCRALQSAKRVTVEAIGGCGVSLGERAPLYSTALAVDDLAAILDALGIATIDLYGDSYGTYFAQVFAVRHPGRLRSLVLDGAYPLTGPDYAWYPTSAPAMRDKFNLACARDPACAALSGDSVAHVMPALAALRARPFAARAADSDGTTRSFTATASQLAIVMFGSAPPDTTLTEVDAAARAFAGGDPAPLLRLMAETAAGVDSRDPSADPSKWSAGLAVAVMCQDPPQVFDMQLPPAERAAQRDRVVEERRRTAPDTYAPFTIDEYRAMPLDYSFIDQCVLWPVSPAAHPASQIGLTAVYPDVPALVMSGEFDNMTTLADGAAVASHFKRGTQVRLANSFHVNALPRARSRCGANIVRHFLRSLTPGDTGCAAAVPPLRLVPQFAVSSETLPPAAGLAGNQADPDQLRFVTAAERTVLDVLARARVNVSGHGPGLRGGTYRIAHGDALNISLTRVRWVDDLEVSGRIIGARGRNAPVRASLHIRPAGAVPADPRNVGDLRLIWRSGTEGLLSEIAGRLGSARVAALSSNGRAR